MFRSQDHLGGKALTIGVLTNWVADPYQAAILRGVSQAADTAGANLLVFVGGVIPVRPNGGEDFVYEYARRGILDGLILLSSTLLHEVGVSGLEAFCGRFGDLPVVSIGAELNCAPSITVDNGAGVTAIIDHLVREHGAKNIACIRGPKSNNEAEARTCAYVEALARHNLPFVSRWVIEGNFTSESGTAAVAQLAKLPGFQLRDLDAIIASNDSMAIGALNELAARGVSVPEQVAVVGFDDLPDAQLVQPPLASVAQPLIKLGIAGARCVLGYVQHGQPPESEVLSTVAVLRRSCGCAEMFAPARSSFAPPPGRSFEVSTLLRRERILLEMTRASKGGLGAAGSGWEQSLFNCLIETISSPLVGGGAFTDEFQMIAERVTNASGDLKLLGQVSEVLRQQMVPLLRGDEQRRERADDVFHMVRGTLSQIELRRLTRRQLSLDRWNHTLALVCNEISGAYSYERLRAILRSQLPMLKVRSCFVAAYTPECGGEHAVLIAAFDAEVDCSAFENRKFRSAELIPAKLAQLGKRPRSYTIHPLLWHGERLGHIVVELDTETLFLSGALCGAVANALRGARTTAATSVK